MNELEKLLEHIAADLVMVDPEDLPALAGIHENFQQLNKIIADDSTAIAVVAQNCAGLISNVILRDVENSDDALAIINDAVTGLQGIIRDKRDPSEVRFPKEVYQSLSEEVSSEAVVKPPEDKKSESTKKTEIKNEKKNVSAKPEENKGEKESMILNVKGGDTELLGDFITEGREHCSTAEESLMELETDSENNSAIDAIFRGFHTIKGAAGFLELGPIILLTHESETFLDMARKGEIIIQGKVADAIFGSIDALRSLFDGIEEAMNGDGSFDGTKVISSLLDNLRQLIANKGQQSETDELECDTGKRVGDILIDMGATKQTDIDNALSKKETPDEKIGQTLVKQGKVPAKAVVHALRQQQKTRDIRTKTVKEMVKIDTERLDKLVDTIGELVIAESMVGQDEQILAMASTKIVRNISHLNKITRELQEMGMAMRLVPIKGAFQKLSRAVRDLSKKSGKKANLNLSGEDSEVDRGIVESIGDPLMHMVRNSLDHGLETPEERIKAGKPETGNVWIRAFHKGGNIYFEIEDDGRGLNKEKILSKAAERGLISANKEMTDKEIYNLVLLPGFSTASKITNISGRGVGMDVVRKNIDSMRGHLEMESQPGKGTKFSMQLPLTLAIIDGMLVGVGNEKFIIPTLSVVESLRLTPEMISTIAEKGEMISLRGELLPIFKTRNLFSRPKSNKTSADSTVVVVDDMNRRVGLVVDELFGQHQIVIKSLGPMFKEQKWISGGAILSDGTIGLIIDVSGIIKLANSIDVYCDLPVEESFEEGIKSIPEEKETAVETVEEMALT
jgi:two-component system chemotaxis sensor kinase CheA